MTHVTHAFIIPAVIHKVNIQTKYPLHFNLHKRQSLILTLSLFGLLDQNSVTAVGSVVNVYSGDFGDDGNSRCTLIFEKKTKTLY